MFTLSIYILIFQLCPILIFVTHNRFQDVVSSQDMIWYAIRMLRYGLSRLRVEARSELKHVTYNVSNNMRRERDETWNIWDRKYIRHRARNTAQIHPNEARHRGKINFLVGIIWFHFQRYHSVIIWMPV